MELLNIWVVAVLLSFSDAPNYESHYQAVTFNNESSCNNFLSKKKIVLSHDLIHIFETQPNNLTDIQFQCVILKGEDV